MRDYFNALATSFRKLTRTDQITLIGKFSAIITLWLAIVVTATFYPLLSPFHKIFFAPVLLILAWLFAKAVVTPFMITKFDRYLN
jgi:hypothetical protein